MSCVRYLSQNFIDPEVIPTRTASSEQASFPVVNIENKQRRSKVWRSAGFWNIQVGVNDTIIFRESIGVDLTATVAFGQYTNAASFFAAIKTALEAVGASTYTVTHTSDFKIQISSNGSGGGGIFELRTMDLNFTLEDEIGYTNASNFTGALTYQGDFLRIHGSEGESILWDMGLSSNPQYFVLTGPRNRQLKISPTAIIKLQGNETNAWGTPSYEKVLTYDDSVIVEFNDTGLHTTELRYWRLNIIDQNPLGYIEIGAIFLGDFYTPTRGQAQFPFSTQYVDNTVNLFSEGGQTFSEIRQKTQSFSIIWSHLLVDEIESFDTIFNDFGTGIPFFVHYDADSVFNTKTNKAMRYVKFQSPPSYNLERPNFFTTQHNFLEQL
jgi:hypothetical protein